MKLRYSADWRTLLWAFVLFPGVAVATYANPKYALWFIPLSLYTGFSSGVLAHYHNHCPVFVDKRVNALYSIWISVFYGYPIFAWIPTHNANHHKFVNGPGDATITWRYTKKDNLFVASTFFFVSSYWQGPLIKAYIKQARENHPKIFRQIVAQYAAVVLGQLGFLAIAIALHGAKTGILVYVCSFGATAAMGMWGMMFINYIQHVHCDPTSKYDHSRNFVGGLGNWLVFNSGYHTAHHEKAGAHWSTLPAIHAEIAPHMTPELNQPSIAWFIAKTYFLGPFVKSLRPHQIGRPAYEAPASAEPAPEPESLAA